MLIISILGSEHTFTRAHEGESVHSIKLPAIDNLHKILFLSMAVFVILSIFAIPVEKLSNFFTSSYEIL